MEDGQPKQIGERLTDARHQAGMTQEELGDLVGVSTRSIAAYEAGDIVPWRHMKKLAEYLGQPVAYLIHGEAADTAYDMQLERILEELKMLRKEIADMKKGGRKPPPSS